MSPAVVAHNSIPEVIKTAETTAETKRVLILCPPSVASNPTVLEKALEPHVRSSTDVQMLDRLVLGLAKLPSFCYSTVILLADPSPEDAQVRIDGDVLQKVVKSMAPGGKWTSAGPGSYDLKAIDNLDVLMSGLMVQDDERMNTTLVKPDYSSTAAVPLNFGSGKASLKPADGSNSGGGSSAEKIPPKKTGSVGKSEVGFVNTEEDMCATIDQDDDDDDDLIDEDTLLNEYDLSSPIQIPPECRPKTGKRRRACKDCTCGLREKLEAEDKEKRAAADAALSSIVVKLGGDDLAEVDFTVEGKISSCGNCYLGDAFRCDGCPYIGLPAFKPGEDVQINFGDDQL